MSNFAYLPRALHIAFGKDAPLNECAIPSDFFGICAAAAPDPAGDDYIVARLRELKLQHVRVDLMQDTDNFQSRLIHRLIKEGFRVCLHLVQYKGEAERMAYDEVRERWRGFVCCVLDEFGTQLEMLEIGSTVNRERWAGHTVPGFLDAWRVAWNEAKSRGVRIAGPNVTDFEPFFNVALLHEMKKAGMPPDVHTENLFVERATEPEAFDHKIIGRRAARLIRFNLLKKAFIIDEIARRAGVSSTMVPHVSWSLRRIARLYDDVEEKQADYLARYCCLAAASGCIQRLYWGPLIGQREGLVDDGTHEFPDIPHVTFYGKANGCVRDYRLRPAFFAFHTASALIAGARFQRRIKTGAGLEIIELATPERTVHAAWTMDGMRAHALDCYAPESIAAASALSRDGKTLPSVPSLFSESPVYLSWPAGFKIETLKSAAPIAGLRFAHPRARDFTLVDQPPWTGAAIVSEGGTAVDPIALLDLARQGDERGRECVSTDQSAAQKTDTPKSGRIESQTASVLRDARNKVWTAPAPWNAATRLVIKRFQPRGWFRRLVAFGKQDKAARSWNGAQELARRGIATPPPVAFFHAHPSAPESECWYICREYENTRSVRDAFNAFSAGAGSFGEMNSDSYYEALSRFLLKMHERGVFFRDLSAGNLLCRFKKDAGVEFSLIDTARARFYPHPLCTRLRLCDLMRICHPLHWPGRHEFAGKYLSLMERQFSAWMKIPFIYYDIKHRIKNAIKPFRPGKRKKKPF